MVGWRSGGMAQWWDGAVGDGAVGDGAVRDGAVRDGAVGDGAVGDGAVGDGAVGDGAVGDGAVGDGAVGDGAVGDGAVEGVLVSHQCGPGSIPGLGAICGLSFLLAHVLASRFFFSRYSGFSSFLKN